MVLISHRGNLNGKIESKENSPKYIREALDLGYDVEIDVWWYNNDFYLGHDLPQHKINLKFLENDRLWCHAKNIDCLDVLLAHSSVHSFWHQEDDVTVTSNGYIWTYPGKMLTKKSICVLPEQSNQKVENCFGICSDYISRYK